LKLSRKYVTLLFRRGANTSYLSHFRKIRRNKMTKNLSHLERLEIVLKGWRRRGKTKKKFCDENGISCSTYDRWEKDILVRLSKLITKSISSLLPKRTHHDE
jgi:hypothetical protein